MSSCGVANVSVMPKGWHIFLQVNFTNRSNDSKKEEQFFIPKFHVDYNEIDSKCPAVRAINHFG